MVEQESTLMNLPNEFYLFLLRAKRATYAAGVRAEQSSRPASQDLPYQEGDWLYLDTYLGGLSFIGEEAVWLKGRPVWGMNYYGWMLCDEIPEGFSQFLKESLMLVPPDAPYRGPREHRSGRYKYCCTWEGSPRRFHGREWIEFDDVPVYELRFHGGEVI
jgi:hypothetical protein